MAASVSGYSRSLLEDSVVAVFPFIQRRRCVGVRSMDALLLDDLVPQQRIHQLQQPKQAHGRHLNNGKSKDRPGRRSRSRSKQGKHPICRISASNAWDRHKTTPETGVEFQEHLTAEDVNQFFTDGGEQHREKQSWSDRQASEAENWCDIRSAVFQDVLGAQAIPLPGSVCSSCCSSAASIICDNCPTSSLCATCDIDRHTLQPFHRRQHWTRGFLEPLSPGTSVTANGEYVEYAPVLPLHGSKKECHPCNTSCEVRASSAMVIAITLQGRFDLHLPIWSCPTCRNEKEVEQFDLFRCGFYRASPVKLSTVVHQDVFIMWQKLRFRSPGTSFSAFIASLEELGTSYGCSGPIDFERLERAFTEWTCIQFELQGLQGRDSMTCEACGGQPRCIHLDGNFKVYRYRSSGSGDMTSAYHVGTFIEDKDSVNLHLAKLKGVPKTSNRCGNSTWAAGRNDPETLPSKRLQDETGLIAATCRHSVILGGVNMYRGESYAYSHFLHQLRFPHVQYYASDIVCKYWPWAQRVSVKWPEYNTGDSKPFLSVMHATGHAYYCQITFGGFWQDGSGWSIMETTEIANAFLSRAGNTTKYMTSAQRNDTLTDMVLNYNEDKHQHMPKLLVTRLQDAEKRIPDLRSRLDSLLHEQGVPPDDVVNIVEELRVLAKALSQRDILSKGRNLENAIEMVSDSVRVRLAAVSNVASTSKERRRFWRLVAADKVKLAKLLSRYERESGNKVEVTDAVEGAFPWHVGSVETGGLSLSTKRAICDTYMRLQRSVEELEIVKEEMRSLLTRSESILGHLLDTLKVVDDQLCREEAERAPIFRPVAVNHRYCVQHESAAVLRGLQAAITQAVADRQKYMDYAHSLLDGYLSAPPTERTQ